MFNYFQPPATVIYCPENVFYLHCICTATQKTYEKYYFVNRERAELLQMLSL